MVTTLDNLSYASALNGGQVLWNFSKVNELVTPISRPPVLMAVPGVHGKYDPMGYDPFFLDAATLKVKFWHKYVGAETYWSVKDQLWGAIGNQAVFLYIVESDGITTKRNIAKLITRPNDETVEKSLQWCEFELEFQLSSPFWKAPPPPGALFYDNGQQYDVGLAYDVFGQSVICSGAAGEFDLVVTNAGNAPEYEARISIAGAMPGKITVANKSIILSTGYLQMSWNPAIPPANPNLGVGETLIIDTGLGWVLRNGVPDFGHFTWGIVGSGQREWFRIDKGPNTIAIMNDGGSASALAQCLSLDTWVV